MINDDTGIWLATCTINNHTRVINKCTVCTVESVNIFAACIKINGRIFGITLSFDRFKSIIIAV